MICMIDLNLALFILSLPFQKRSVMMDSKVLFKGFSILINLFS